jgi:hypothetical protein
VNPFGSDPVASWPMQNATIIADRADQQRERAAMPAP